MDILTGKINIPKAGVEEGNYSNAKIGQGKKEMYLDM